VCDAPETFLPAGRSGGTYTAVEPPTGESLGPQATIDAFTETQRVTLRGDLPHYLF
jgi:hypothetical protein